MGNIWSKEQTEKVNQLDADFEIAVKEAGIERNSKDAFYLWRSGGFQQRMFDIFKKEDAINWADSRYFDKGGPIPSDLQGKLADYKKRVANPLLPASAKAKLEEIIAGMEAELAKTPTITDPEIIKEPKAQSYETLQTRLGLLIKMNAKKPSVSLKSRIKILKKMMDKLSSRTITSASDDSAYERLVAIANDNNIDEDDKKKIKKEEVAQLVAAGYTLPQLETIYFGYKYNRIMAGDNELNSIGGFMSYRDEAVAGQIKSLVENQQNNEFELGLKYPDFNWKAIIKKYSIASKPQIIEKEHVYPDGDNDVYIYEIYSGKDVVVGHSIGRKRFKKGKLEETIMNDNQIGDVSKQKKSEMKPGFNGGYWGVASSKIDVIDDIAKMLTSQKDSYVKDVDIYVNGLGGVAPDDLKANNIKFEQGGEIGCGCKHALRAAKGTKIKWDSGAGLNVHSFLVGDEVYVDGNYDPIGMVKSIGNKNVMVKRHKDGKIVPMNPTKLWVGKNVPPPSEEGKKIASNDGLLSEEETKMYIQNMSEVDWNRMKPEKQEKYAKYRNFVSDKTIQVLSTESLPGKYVNIYRLGVVQPSAYKIISAKITPENFDQRNVTLTFDGDTQEVFPLRDYTKFIAGEQIKIKDSSGDPYLLELIS